MHPLRPLDLALETAATTAKLKAEELHMAWNRARNLLLQYAKEMERRANNDRLDYSFKEGDMVWLASKNFTWKHGARKLAPKWLGPFTITEVIGPASYRMALPHDWKLHPVFHVSLLKELKGQEYQAPAPTKVRDGEPEWEVDTIVTHRTLSGNQKDYLVHWKGYGREWQSWLTEEAMQGSPALLRDYWRTKALNPSAGDVSD
jgi:hypothetical protein